MKSMRLRQNMTQRELGKAVGAGPGVISHLETLRRGTTENKQKVASFFSCSSAWMFPDWTEEIKTHKVVKKIGKAELTTAQAAMLQQHEQVRLLAAAPDEVADQVLLKKHLEPILKMLTPREQMVITMRFGLDGKGEWDLGEVAENFAVSRERIRQIEHKALRRLRGRGIFHQIEPLYYGHPTTPHEPAPVYEPEESIAGIADKIEAVLGPKRPT